MNNEQLNQYYERIEKLLNGSNKETYGFVPEEIRQILRWYEEAQQRIDKAIEYIEYIGMDATFDKVLIEILKGEKND